MSADNRSSAIDRAIEVNAHRVGRALAPGFAVACRKYMTSATVMASVSAADVTAAVAAYADEYIAGAKEERARILAIDQIADQLPAGHENLIRRAKFESLQTAEEVAVQALSSIRQTAHEMPSSRN